MSWSACSSFADYSIYRKRKSVAHVRVGSEAETHYRVALFSILADYKLDKLAKCEHFVRLQYARHIVCLCWSIESLVHNIPLGTRHSRVSERERGGERERQGEGVREN